MWECTSCGWTGETGDLKPAVVSVGIQGVVKTSVCPKCGKTVGDYVNIVDSVPVEEEGIISQEISEAGTGEAEPEAGSQVDEGTGTGEAEPEAGSQVDEGAGTGEAGPEAGPQEPGSKEPPIEGKAPAKRSASKKPAKKN